MTTETQTPPDEKEKKAQPVKFEFEHVKLMEEEKIESKDLPKDIKDLMKGLNLSVTSYNKKPTDELKEKIMKQDIVIAEKIQSDVVEKDLPSAEEAAAAKAAQDKADADAAAKAAQDKADADAAAKAAQDKADADAKAKADEEAVAKDPSLKFEKAVREKVKDGKISTADLEAIIGRKADVYNSTEKFGTLKLKKVWLQDIWEEVK